MSDASGTAAGGRVDPSPPAPGNPLFLLLPLNLVVFCGFMTIGLPLPALPHQVHDVLGYGPIMVGVTIGLQSLVTVVSRGVGGKVCDVRGAKAAVLLGLPCAMVAGAAYLASAFAVAIPLASLAVLLVGRMLLGVAESLFMTGGLTWSIARVGPASAGRAMAQQGIAMYGALGVGAPIGLALYQAYGFVAVAAASIVLPAIGCAIALTQPHPERSGSRGGGGSFLKVVGMIWPMGLGLALGTTSYAALAGFLPLYFTAHHWGGAGFALSAFAVFYIGVRLFLAHLPDRVGGSQVAVASLLVIIVGQITLWAGSSEIVAIAGTAVTGAGYSLLFPSFGVQAMRRAPPEMRGLAVGAFMAFFDVALGVAGPLCGLVASRFGYGSVFVIGAVAAMSSVVLTLAVRSRANA